MNRPRSAARGSLAQTILIRRLGSRASSQISRAHTCVLLPWSRGSSTSALRLAVRNASRSRRTAAWPRGLPRGSVKNLSTNALTSSRASRSASLLRLTWIPAQVSSDLLGGELTVFLMAQSLHVVDDAVQFAVGF